MRGRREYCFPILGESRSNKRLLTVKGPEGFEASGRGNSFGLWFMIEFSLHMYTLKSSIMKIFKKKYLKLTVQLFSQTVPPQPSPLILKLGAMSIGILSPTLLKGENFKYTETKYT